MFCRGFFHWHNNVHYHSGVSIVADQGWAKSDDQKWARPGGQTQSSSCRHIRVLFRAEILDHKEARIG